MESYRELERLAVWEQELDANDLAFEQREVAMRIESGEAVEVDIDWF